MNGNCVTIDQITHCQILSKAIEEFMLSSSAISSQGNWTLPPLFSITKTNKLRVWMIRFVEADKKLYSRSGELCTKDAVNDPEGLSEAFKGSFDEIIANLRKIDIYVPMADALERFGDNPTEIVPKQKRNVQQQALQEAKKMHKDKVKTTAAVEDLVGLVRETVDIAFIPQGPTAYFFPDDPKHNKNHITAEQFRRGVVCQVKYNGNHCVAYAVDPTEEVLDSHRTRSMAMMSRQNEFYGHLELQRAQCVLLLKHLPNGTYLDGEIVHSDGLHHLRTIIDSSERDPRMDEVVYWLFDIYYDDLAILHQRIDTLAAAYDAYTKEPDYVPGVIQLIENHEFRSLEEVKSFYEKTIAAGHEGIVVRKTGPESRYLKAKHSSNVYKIKPVEDAEATVIGVNKSARGEAVFVLKMDEGIEFKCTAHGTLVERRDMYEKRADLIGKTYTYRYSVLTHKNVPFHAQGVAFRDMKRH